MTVDGRRRLNGYAGWVIAVLAILALCVGFGEMKSELSASTTANKSQDESIAVLKIDTAIIKANTTRTAEDVDNLNRKMDTLIRRP